MTQKAAPFRFRLYVTGDAPNSARAVLNLTDFCQLYLAERYHIEIVDLAHEPQRALADRVFMTPTLVKLAPAPEVRIIGSLSEVKPILESLGLGTA